MALTGLGDPAAVAAGDLRGRSAPGAHLRGVLLARADLVAADLRDADLRGADLRGARLHEARLRRADLRGAKLSGIRARDLDLERALLPEADLSGALLDGAVLLEADLRGAKLAGADLSRADLRGASLADADLTGADLTGADLSGADLAGARLDGVTWVRAHIEGVTGLPSRTVALDAGAWEGAVSPDLAPLVRVASVALSPLRRAARGVARQALDGASSLRERLSSQQRRADAAAARAQRRERMPGGPGADLSGQDLSGRHLEEVDWTGATLRRLRAERAHLQQALLSGADLTDARLGGARLRGARLDGACLDAADLVDADLRDTDLRGARLHGANLTGADLRGARLAVDPERTAPRTAPAPAAEEPAAEEPAAEEPAAEEPAAAHRGADLTGADLTAARLSDLDLTGVCLDRAVLDQADLAGADLTTASVVEADLRGVLGLSPAAFDALAERGARVTRASLVDALRRVQPRQLLAGAGVVALGVGAFALTRQLAGEDPALERDAAAEVAALQDLPPEEARSRFEDLAADSVSVPDRVGYLREAAGAARRAGDDDAAIALLRDALAAAGAEVELATEVRLSLAERLADMRGLPPDQALARNRDARALLSPLLSLARQPTEQRARAMLLHETLAERAEAAGDTDAAAVAAALQAGVHRSLADLPDAHAELYVALASGRSNRGDIQGALADLDRAAALDTSTATTRRVEELRARALEQAGREDEALAVWRALMAGSPPGSDGHLAARLATADLLQRTGATAEASELVAAVLAPDVDPRLRARAFLVQARLAEEAGALLPAAEAYRSAVEFAVADPTTADQARTALARLVGSADDEALRAIAADLGADAASMIEVQGDLGRARAHLEANEPDEARVLLEALAERPDLDETSRRDVQTSLGEALALQGDVPAALVVWRDLLASTEHARDRTWLELRIAQGLVRGGRPDEAAEAYARLAEDDDPDISTQGRMGLAQVALARGETEAARALLIQVAEQPTDGRESGWHLQALEELALLATESGDHGEAADRWRALAALAPDSRAAHARRALVEALVAGERFTEARAACREAATAPGDAIARTGALLLCAEVEERLEDPTAALATYQAVLAQVAAAQADAPPPAEADPDAAQALRDTLLDGTIGGARVAIASEQPVLAADLAARALAMLGEDGDPGARLSLLGVQIQALTAAGDPEAADRAADRRDRLLAEALPAAEAGSTAGAGIPDAEDTAALDALVQAAHTARGQGRSGEGAALLRRAVDAAPASRRAGLLLELGDALVEAEDLDAALPVYREAAATGGAEVQALSAMGEAELHLRQGQPDAAVAALADAASDDPEVARWLAEARARAETAVAASTGDGSAGTAAAPPSAEATADGPEEVPGQEPDQVPGQEPDEGTAEETAVVHPDLAAVQLREAGDAALARDDFDEALARYTEAARTAVDPYEAGLARVHIAQTHQARGQDDLAGRVLDTLLEHPVPEVALQAAIERSHLAADAESWDLAVAVLAGREAAALGPGWDASLVDARVLALTGTGDLDGARDALLHLAERWPDQPEALVPAWVGLAYLEARAGDPDAARSWAERALEASEDPGHQAQARAALRQVGG